MKWCGVLFLVLVVLTTGEASRPILERCIPGENFIENGKVCLCLQSGYKIGALCGLEEKPLKRDGTESDDVWADPINSSCEPGEEIVLHGKSCCCPHSGLVQDAVCPLAGKNVVCPKDGLYDCAAGSLFIDSNSRLCFCVPPGYFSDSICIPFITIPLPNLMPLPMPPVLPSSSRRIGGDECTPGEIVPVDGLTCTCPPDGILLLPDDCEDAIIRSPGCAPGTYFPKGGEICWCPFSGDVGEAECHLDIFERSSMKASTRGGTLPSVPGCGLR